jgi:phosphoribosylformimino-5-aminoimidazole carboxamide ribotide isomerase
MKMIIPVLDLKNGMAVSGKSGRRETYRPLKTVFHPSSHPEMIAQSLKEAGAQRLYLADLDAIEGTGSNWELVGKINKTIPVMVDAGINDAQGVKEALKLVNRVIVATETLKNLHDLDEIFASPDRDRIILSIDVKDGKVLSKNMKTDFDKILRKIREFEPDEIILLDISRVGTEKGVDQDLINKFRGWESRIILGGGITESDIDTISDWGISKFLVGSALHHGKFMYKF